MSGRERSKVLLVGLGGLGCPTALLLTKAGVGTLTIVEDDTVDASNLHRQILYHDDDVGHDKLKVGLAALAAKCPQSPTRLQAINGRLLPDNARTLVAAADVVVEGSDNFATKFLCADACRLEKKPCVQGAAVRWVATALSTAPSGSPCYRCLFEDLPAADQAPNCAEAGVLGSVVGFGAALMAELALRIIDDRPDYGHVYCFDAKRDSLRRHPIYARIDCPLCGNTPRITEIGWSTYLEPACQSA